MTAPQYDDASVAYDSPETKYDGGCVATITYDEAGLSWDALDVTYEGCDHRTVTPPPVEEPVAVGAGPSQVRDIYAEERTLLFREDEEVLVMLL